MLWLGLVVGLIVGLGVGLGTMYFAQKKGLVSKLEAKVILEMAKRKGQAKEIAKDLEGLKKVKAGDLDDELKAIRDKLKKMF